MPYETSFHTAWARDNKQIHVSPEATPVPTTLHQPTRSATCRTGYRPKGKISPPPQWMWLICSPDLPAAQNCLVLARARTVHSGENILLVISRNCRTARWHRLPVEAALADVQAQLCDTGKRTYGAIARCRETCCGKMCTDRQCCARSLYGSA